MSCPLSSWWMFTASSQLRRGDEKSIKNIKRKPETMIPLASLGIYRKIILKQVLS
jgi:hypothetical protein